MTRKEFYAEYWTRTDRAFSDRFVWDGEGRKAAWQKGQRLTSKLERKVFIAVQYACLLFCWVPMCLDPALCRDRSRSVEITFKPNAVRIAVDNRAVTVNQPF